MTHSPDTDALHAEVAAYVAAKREKREAKRRERAAKKVLAAYRRDRREMIEPTERGLLLAQRAARHRAQSAAGMRALRERRRQAKESS